ncbi:hypothetical protein K458DRAFT_293521, partial [Lentithecium fluviatile CBS 122367]
RKHVLCDIQPYVCTFGECDLFDHFFKSREEWFRHEAQHHRAKWFCNSNNHPTFDAEPGLLAHMEGKHA